jgi:hypothetical protein
LSSSSTLEEKNAKNDNKLRGLLSFVAIEAKQLKTTMSWDLVSSSSFAPKEKKLGDDNEPPDSLLSFAPEEKNAKNNNEPLGLLSSFAIEAKQPRVTTSLDLGLLSSSTTE